MSSRRGERFSWIDGIGLVAATSPAWIALAAFVMAGTSEQWTHVLAGSKETNLTRNLLELLYFVAGVAVALIALVAIIVARTQAREASNLRLSTVYMEIVNRWNAQDLVEARLKLFSLVDQYEALPAPAKNALSVGGYIRDHIMALKGVDWREFRKYIVLLQFFEDLGMLCWKEYIDKRDICEFIGQAITTQLAYFGPYIQAARKQNPNTELTLYSNAIYLYKFANAFVPLAHKEEMWNAN